MLTFSPKFGDEIIKMSLQKKLNDMGTLTRFFAKVIYGKGALNWDNVRTKPDGLAVESYLKEHYLLPKLQGQTISKEEEKKIMEEAQKLVKVALKNYEK
jgi:hypothetical protein